MKVRCTSIRKQAFTLIELLAVIAIIGVLFTLVSPQIGKALFRAKLTKESAKARYIVEAITAKESASRFSLGWPQAGDEGVNTSTEFLASLVRDGYLDVDFSFFAGPGMVPAMDENDFSAENNIWCIVRDVGDITPGNTPVVYTKNLDINTLTFMENEPLGKKGFAFATKNGEAITVHQAEMSDHEVFSAIFRAAAIFRTNDVPVLTP